MKIQSVHLEVACVSFETVDSYFLISLPTPHSPLPLPNSHFSRQPIFSDSDMVSISDLDRNSVPSFSSFAYSFLFFAVLTFYSITGPGKMLLLLTLHNYCPKKFCLNSARTHRMTCEHYSISAVEVMDASRGGGGGYMTCGWTGVCRPVFRMVPSSNYRKLPSYPLL